LARVGSGRVDLTGTTVLASVGGTAGLVIAIILTVGTSVVTSAHAVENTTK
jgi:hypothetical protein